MKYLTISVIVINLVALVMALIAHNWQFALNNVAMAMSWCYIALLEYRLGERDKR